MNKIMLSRNTYRCRLCLKVSNEVINIFREDFAKMIKLLTTIQVQQSDELPKVACVSCTRRVKASMIIRKQIIKSHKTLLEEALAKKNNITNTRTNSQDSSQTSLNKSEKEANIAPETVFIKIDDDTNIKQEEEIIIIDSPEPPENETTLIPTDNQISSKPNEKSLQDLPISLKEISIVRISKSNDNKITRTPIPRSTLVNNTRTQIRRGTKSQPLSPALLRNVKNVQVIRRVPRMNFKPAINVDPQPRRGPKPKPSASKYNPLTPVPCKICSKHIQKTNMKKHLEIHDKKTVICQFCGKVTDHTSLRAHIFYFHKCKADEYVCDQCGRHFRYKNKFNLHMKKQHGGTKDHECTICGRKFFEKKYLTKHIDCHHKKIRAFICDYCGKDLSTKHALKVHLRQHTEIAPYCCDTCGMKFRQNVSLKTHRKQAHDIYEEENVFCEVCGKGFASAVALKSHFRLHERKKCPHCTEVFVKDDYLERHIKDKHGAAELNSDNDDIEAKHATAELNSDNDDTEAKNATELNSDNDDTETEHATVELNSDNGDTEAEPATAELNSDNDETGAEHAIAELNSDDELGIVQDKNVIDDFLDNVNDILA